MFQKIHHWPNSTKVGAAVSVLLFIAFAVSTYQIARSKFDEDAYTLLNQKWATLKGYVRIDINPLGLNRYAVCGSTTIYVVREGG